MSFGSLRYLVQLSIIIEKQCSQYHLYGCVFSDNYLSLAASCKISFANTIGQRVFGAPINYMSETRKNLNFQSGG